MSTCLSLMVTSRPRAVKAAQIVVGQDMTVELGVGVEAVLTRGPQTLERLITRVSEPML